MKVAISILLLALAGCQEATCQPYEKTVQFGALPPELRQMIGAGFPHAKLDSATDVDAMTGRGYRVQLHDDHWRYTINFVRNGRLASQSPIR